jgi:hypothetical protein
MPQYLRKPDPFKQVRQSLDVGVLSGDYPDHTLKPPIPNSLAEVPYTRLVHSLDDLNDLSRCAIIDSGTVTLVQRGLLPLELNATRQEVTLNLLGRDGELFKVTIWAIPIYDSGVMAHLLYAADHENLMLLRERRNPVKPLEYDITSL